MIDWIDCYIEDSDRDVPSSWGGICRVTDSQWSLFGFERPSGNVMRPDRALAVHDGEAIMNVCLRQYISVTESNGNGRNRTEAINPACSVVY